MPYGQTEIDVMLNQAREVLNWYDGMRNVVPASVSYTHLAMDAKLEFIKFMVRSGVLTFGDFTAKSGRKTPYFVNTGKYRTGAQLAQLGEHYARCIVDNHLEGAKLLFGPAYKGCLLYTSASWAPTR